VLYGAGWPGGAVLAAFFVSSNLLSRIGRAPTPVAPVDSKGDRRDLWQVYANGAVAAAVALGVTGDLSIWLVTATLAAASADTWATSIGSRSSSLPRLLGIGQRVIPGTSGGMTLSGTAAGVLGAAAVSVIGALVSGLPALFPAGTLVGSLGMVTDSALGALVQGRFRCSTCDEPSEWRVHRCGQRTLREAGLAWVDNDVVNFLATASAAVAGLLLWWWLVD
jgi:uncharacterized protein (TIGR00297 family)